MDATAAKPVTVGILSGGPTVLNELLVRAAGVTIVLHEDLAPPAPAIPNDDGLSTFLTLMGEIYRQPPPRPLTYAIVGGASDIPRIERGFARLLDADVDLLAWWTIMPMAADAEAAFDTLLRQATERRVAAIFPGPVRLGHGHAAAFPVHGVIATRPYLDICPFPPGWADTAAPSAASWGDWPTMRASWVGAGMPDRLPRAMNPTSGHVLAVWSIVAALAAISAVRPERPPLEDLAGMLQTVCVPVTVRPPGLTPRLGFLEPRQIQVASDRARLA